MRPPTPTGRRHELKTWPGYFAAIAAGIKTFELRRDDRPGGYREGDILDLVEHDKDTGPTGCRLERFVLYVLTGPAWGLEAGWACMAIGETHESIAEILARKHDGEPANTDRTWFFPSCAAAQRFKLEVEQADLQAWRSVDIAGFLIPSDPAWRGDR